MTTKRLFDFVCSKCRKRVREVAPVRPEMCSACQATSLFGSNGAPRPAGNPARRMNRPSSGIGVGGAHSCEPCGGTGMKNYMRCSACDGEGTVQA
ncbi:MAG: hypothetical protein ABII00_07885 [Elusimicrobiota bacterium]